MLLRQTMLLLALLIVDLASALQVAPGLASSSLRSQPRRTTTTVAQFGFGGGGGTKEKESEGFSLPSLSNPFEDGLPNPFPETPEEGKSAFPSETKKGLLGGTKANPLDVLGLGPRGETDSKSYQVKSFEQGTDFLFFQSPSPATGVQEELPDFFSVENLKFMLDALKITPVRLAVGAVGLLSFLAIGQTVWTAPGSASPFAFVDDFIPSAREYRKGERQKRVDEDARLKKIADEKKAAEKKAADEAAAAAAAAAKAAAATAAKAPAAAAAK